MDTAEEKINNSLRKVLKSDTFNKSKTNQRLLKYLVKSSLEGQNPKEFTIGAEVFNKKYTAGQDPNIRVYVHNLRKKLAEYYEQEGKEDDLIFEIKKGQYKVDFLSNEPEKKKFPESKIIFIGLAIILLVISNTGWWFFSQPGKSLGYIQKSNIWESFIHSEKPTLMIIGDHYVFTSQLYTDQVGVSRDTRINSDEDLDNYLKENPEKIKGINRTKLTYLTKQGPFSLFKVMPIFTLHQKEIKLQLASETLWDDVKGRNVIFIGSYKTLGDLSKITDQLQFSFDSEEVRLKYYDNTNDTLFSYKYYQELMEQATVDYALVSFIKGTNDVNFFFFLCNHDIGNIATVDFFTNPEKLKQFEDQLSENATGFKSLFEVKGMERTNFNLKQLMFEQLDKNLENLWE
ncbi:hypothetical protein [Flexithrix dorotheae]|uniref:hypothetical protein n=1 Tax=Flexithrix dorotheae TaxID=70993 RepID=UPI00036FF680|nr:hypothetical protein [Flexithrix dorotheae]